MDASMREPLHEREALIETRADVVLDAALTERNPWTKALAGSVGMAGGRNRAGGCTCGRCVSRSLSNHADPPLVLHLSHRTESRGRERKQRSHET